MNTTTSNQAKTVPVYQTPTVTTYTANELMNLIGPVEAGSHNPGDDCILDFCGNEAGYYAPEANEGVA